MSGATYLSDRILGCLVEPSLAVQLDQLGDLLAVDLRPRKSQFLFERFLQDLNIPVFTEHQRHNQPIIPRPNLSITAPVTQKSPAHPAVNSRWSPVILSGFVVER